MKTSARYCATCGAHMIRKVSVAAMVPAVVRYDGQGLPWRDVDAFCVYATDSSQCEGRKQRAA